MHPDDFRFGVVVLAAGASTRLGQPKQLLAWNGESLLRRSASIALAAGGDPVVMVLGANVERMKSELNGSPITLVVNNTWEEGMGTSVRTGIAALSAAPPDVVLLLLCDQPFVAPETLRALITAHKQTGRPAVVSDYGNGALGPPCLFARPLFPRLLDLKGAQGAKQVFSHLPAEEVGYVSFAGGAIDIDTPEDWDRLARGAAV